MSASRVADGSVLRTGLSHVALGLVTFGTPGAGAFGAAMLFGSEEAYARAATARAKPSISELRRASRWSAEAPDGVGEPSTT